MDRLNSQQHRANKAAIHSKDNKAGDGDTPLFVGTWVSFSVKSCTVVWRTRRRNAGVLDGLSFDSNNEPILVRKFRTT